MAARPPYPLPSQHVFPPTASHHHQLSNKTFEKLVPQMAMETPCHLGEPAVSKAGFVGKGRNWGKEAPLLKCYYLILTTTLQEPCLYSLFRGVDTGAPPGTLPRGGAGTIPRTLCELTQETPAQSPFSRSHLGEVETPVASVWGAAKREREELLEAPGVALKGPVQAGLGPAALEHHSLCRPLACLGKAPWTPAFPGKGLFPILISLPGAPWGWWPLSRTQAQQMSQPPGRGLRNQAGQHEDEGKPRLTDGQGCHPGPLPLPCRDSGTPILTDL